MLGWYVEELWRHFVKSAMPFSVDEEKMRSKYVLSKNSWCFRTLQGRFGFCADYCFRRILLTRRLDEKYVVVYVAKKKSLSCHVPF